MQTISATPMRLQTYLQKVMQRESWSLPLLWLSSYSCCRRAYRGDVKGSQFEHKLRAVC